MHARASRQRSTETAKCRRRPWRAGANSGAKHLADMLQKMIDDLEVDMATIDELQDIHDRK